LLNSTLWQRGIETKNGEMVVPDLPEVSAISETGTNIEATENILANAITALDNLGVETTAAHSAYFDYLTANAETKVTALNTAVETITTTIDMAIEQQAVAGGDLRFRDDQSAA
jgi:hypothetical protein